jgi:hypothetical protein
MVMAILLCRRTCIATRGCTPRVASSDPRSGALAAQRFPGGQTTAAAVPGGNCTRFRLMSPQVVAAVIAASASLLTLFGTLAAQYFGRRATSRDTEKTLDRTLAEQRERLDRTLTEQGRHLDRTLAEQRTRTLNERFAAAASQLGNDKPPAVQLAGVYAMAGLADDWPGRPRVTRAHRTLLMGILPGGRLLDGGPDPDRRWGGRQEGA